MDVKDREGEIAAAKKSDVRLRASKFLKEAFFGLLYALCGYFLGGLALPFGALPFGVALLCAADRKVFYIYLGLCVAAFGSEMRLLLIGVYTALTVIRISVRLLIDPPWKKEKGAEAGERTVAEVYPYMFSENIALRMSSSAIGAFAIGAYRLIEGGNTYYDLYGALIAAFAAPLAVLLVSGYFGVWGDKPHLKLVGFLALSFGAVYAIGDRKLYGLSLALALSTFLTLYITRRGGTVIGILSGALLGLAISLETVPMLAFAALASGLLFPMSATLAAMGALSVSVAWGIYVQGIGILNGAASALVSSALIFTVWDKLVLSRSAGSEEEKEAAASDKATTVGTEDILEKDIQNMRITHIEESLSGVKESFESMSEVLYGISRHMGTPAAADVKQICDNAFDATCASCESRSVCWSEKYRETSDALSLMSEAILKKGSVGIEDSAEELVSRCSRLPDILSEINHNTFLHTQRLMEGDRTEVFALDYSAIAEFMEEALKKDPSEYERDIALSNTVTKELCDSDVGVLKAYVYGKRKVRISILGESRSELDKSKNRIREIASSASGISLRIGSIDPELPILRLEEAGGLTVSTARKNLCAEGEDEYCGDTSGIFRLRDGKLYSFISDGMGSGREAALTSGLVGVFLRKFLAGGCSPESTLKLINGFLGNRGGGSLCECSATVDLMELDLLEKRAYFYKSGAAPTYVFRKGGLFKIRSHTVPVGIIKELDSRRIDLDVDRGDIVVMVSDGVTDGKEECPWLFDLLRSHGESATPERLAELVVKYAKAEGAGDDISVSVIKIQ